MMGTGKSSIGPRLAKMLKLPFYDIDAEIVAAQGKPIGQIFAQDGEAAFRKIEAATIADRIASGVSVIATGGGALTTPETADRIADKTLSVWLYTDVTIMLRRTRNSDRPLLANPNPAETLRTLMAAREPLYARAQLHLSTSRGTPASLTRQLVEMIDAHI
jgi:shikimate kinase